MFIFAYWYPLDVYYSSILATLLELKILDESKS